MTTANQIFRFSPSTLKSNHFPVASQAVHSTHLVTPKLLLQLVQLRVETFQLRFLLEHFLLVVGHLHVQLVLHGVQPLSRLLRVLLIVRELIAEQRAFVLGAAQRVLGRAQLLDRLHPLVVHLLERLLGARLIKHFLVLQLHDFLAQLVLRQRLAEAQQFLLQHVDAA